jgi:hypothetical protein
LDALVCTFLSHPRGADEVSQWGVRAAHHCFKILSGPDEVIRQWGVMSTHKFSKLCGGVFSAIPNIIYSIKKGDQTSFFT